MPEFWIEIEDKYTMFNTVEAENDNEASKQVLDDYLSRHIETGIVNNVDAREGLRREVKVMIRKSIKGMKLHSRIDIMTNSSAEMFVIPAGRGKTKEDFLNFIEPIWEQYKKEKLENDPSWADYYGIKEDTKFEDIVNIFIPTEGIRESYFYDSFGGREVEHIYQAYHPGDLVICGTVDNIIPYAFFTLIEDMFSAERYHLG